VQRPRESLPAPRLSLAANPPSAERQPVRRAYDGIAAA
jgi:hypothetical protein